MVYDITSEKSFDNVVKWRDSFIENASPAEPILFPFILLGNKVDRESERQVQAAKAKQWCKDNNEMPHYETSALENIGVDEAFIDIAKIALKREHEQNETLVMPGTIGGAEGAIRINATDDMRRSVLV